MSVDEFVRMTNPDSIPNNFLGRLIEGWEKRNGVNMVTVSHKYGNLTLVFIFTLLVSVLCVGVGMRVIEGFTIPRAIVVLILLPMIAWWVYTRQKNKLHRELANFLIHVSDAKNVLLVSDVRILMSEAELNLRAEGRINELRSDMQKASSTVYEKRHAVSILRDAKRVLSRFSLYDDEPVNPNTDTARGARAIRELHKVVV